MSDTTSITAVPPAAASTASVASAAAVLSPDQDNCFMDDFELCRLALSVVLQNDTPNALHEIATFSRLLCVNRELGESLQKAAVGRLVAAVILWPKTRIGSAYDRRGWADSVTSDRVSTKSQLRWVNKQLQYGSIQQLQVNGVPAAALQVSYTQVVNHLLPRFCSENLCASYDKELQLKRDARKAAARLKSLLPNRYKRFRGPLYAGEAGAHPHGGDWHSLSFRVAGSCGLLLEIPKPHLEGQQLQTSAWHVTQLTLELGDQYDAFCPEDSLETCRDLALQVLPQLTSLKELCLPFYNPPAGALAPVLSSLTHLTKLFIHHPLKPEQQALPVSLRELAVAREHSYADDCTYLMARVDYLPKSLLPLRISHLTALQNLHIVESYRSYSDDDSERFYRSPTMCQGVPVGSELPVCLKQLQVKAVPHVEPLLGLTALHTLSISHLSVMSPDELMALTRLTSSHVWSCLVIWTQMI